jgi:hypothetical protein
MVDQRLGRAGVTPLARHAAALPTGSPACRICCIAPWRRPAIVLPIDELTSCGVRVSAGQTACRGSQQSLVPSGSATACTSGLRGRAMGARIPPPAVRQVLEGCNPEPGDRKPAHGLWQRSRTPATASLRPPCLPPRGHCPSSAAAAQVRPVKTRSFDFRGTARPSPLLLPVALAGRLRVRWARVESARSSNLTARRLGPCIAACLPCPGGPGSAPSQD